MSRLFTPNGMSQLLEDVNIEARAQARRRYAQVQALVDETTTAIRGWAHRGPETITPKAPVFLEGIQAEISEWARGGETKISAQSLAQAATREVSFVAEEAKAVVQGAILEVRNALEDLIVEAAHDRGENPVASLF